MSSLLDPKSNAEQRPTANSVFDFLYNDSDRVASFLGQFDPSGHLTGLKKLLSVGEASSSSSDISGTGNVGVLKGGMKATNVAGEDYRRGSESTYDPLWANALAFLEHLHTHNMIERDLWGARIGQFVLVKGYLTVLDVSMLKAAWTLPSVQAMIRAGAEPEFPAANRQQRRAAGGGQKQPSQTTEVDLALELLGIMPHLVQARLLGDSFYAWGSLKEDRLITSAGDLLLKHGIRVQGEWAMLGILDAHPQLGAAGDAPETDHVLGVASAVLSHLAPAARTLLGRPDIAHGVTPLLIFREVNPDEVAPTPESDTP
jgi:hypothetical protein